MRLTINPESEMTMLLTVMAIVLVILLCVAWVWWSEQE